MAVQNDYRTWSFKAKADLTDITAGTGNLYKAVSIDTGDIADTGLKANGMLQYAGNSGEFITMGYDGVMKYTASAAITSIGVLLAVTTSGYMAEAGSGDYAVGRNLTTVVSGGVATGMFNFATLNKLG